MKDDDKDRSDDDIGYGNNNMEDDDKDRTDDDVGHENNAGRAILGIMLAIVLPILIALGCIGSICWYKRSRNTLSNGTKASHNAAIQMSSVATTNSSAPTMQRRLSSRQLICQHADANQTVPQYQNMMTQPQATIVIVEAEPLSAPPQQAGFFAAASNLLPPPQINSTTTSTTTKAGAKENWKKIKNSFHASNAFKKGNKGRVRRLSTVMKARRASEIQIALEGESKEKSSISPPKEVAQSKGIVTEKVGTLLKENGSEAPHPQQLLKDWFSEHKIPLTDETIQILNEIGVENQSDMKELDDDDVNNVCSTLKKLQAKRFRKALEPKQST
jgi:hypothetical protein